MSFDNELKTFILQFIHNLVVDQLEIKSERVKEKLDGIKPMVENIGSIGKILYKEISFTRLKDSFFSNKAIVKNDDHFLKDIEHKRNFF